jgi:Hom_end-associated Hint/LAGLIDADG-like domain
MSECNVCAEKFNKTSRCKVTCRCDYNACRACIKTYLLSKSEDAHCMSCKVGWDRKFMADNFEKTFMSKGYRDYREQILIERELGMLQASQPYVEREIKLEKLKVTMQKYRNKYETDIRNLQDEYQAVSGNTVERKKFVRKCPNGDCHGFLSSALKCELCENFACGDCREVTGKTTEEREEHTCNPQIVESVKFLEKDSKPCPKCASMTFKIIGCFEKDTLILMWDQSVKMSQDILIGDILIGDDGEQRNVLNVCSGEDNMYEITQNNGENYVVNSKHTLVLKTVGDDSLVEMLVDDYMKLTETKKKTLVGFKSSNGINYLEQEVHLDPYMLGLWLGDGTHTHPIIASSDIEIQQFVLNWCNQNDAELVHDEAVKFRIRRKGKTNGISTLRNPIGNSNCDTCKGCEYKKMEICDTHEDDNREIHSSKTNPFMDKLSKYNLIGNKHIPKEYLMNSREVRLQVLAGLIDTDGCVTNDGKRIVIGQVNKGLADQIAILSHSLGYVVNRRIEERKNVKCPAVEKKDYQDNHIVNISGSNLSEIPTLLPRKKCQDSNTNKDYQKTAISVKLIGQGTYYGWQVDSNHRFIGNDFTVLKNCSQMFCVECHTPWDWNSGRIVNGQIHNPHYIEYLAQQNKGQAPRNPNEVLCGREIDNQFIIRLLETLTTHRGHTEYYNQNTQERSRTYPFKSKSNENFVEIARNIIHIRHIELPRFNRADQLQDNLQMRIDFMRNKIEKEDFKKKIQKKEKESEKKNEIANVLGMYLNCMTDIFYRLIDKPKDAVKIQHEMDTLRTYTNKCFVGIGKSFNSKMYELNKDFALYRK